jgi:hypothetical protein
MRRHAAPLALVAGLAACGSIPLVDYGEPSPECAPVFETGVPLEWAGRGDLVDLGLVDLEQTDLPIEDIYVGRAAADAVVAPPGSRVYCSSSEMGGAMSGPVPQGWQPP